MLAQCCRKCVAVSLPLSHLADDGTSVVSALRASGLRARRLAYVPSLTAGTPSIGVPLHRLVVPSPHHQVPRETAG